MPSDVKQFMEAELARAYPEGTNYLVLGFSGLSGNETTVLRRKIRQANARLRVVKNSIARLALDRSGLGAAARFVDGPSALLAGEPEMPVLCKLAEELAKEYEQKLTIRGGLFNGAALDAPAVARLAKIPPMPVLRSQIAGGVYGQLAGVASAFQSIARSLACALEGIRKKKETG